MQRSSGPRFTALRAIFFVLASLVATAAHADSGWRLPWRAGQQVFVTQDCNDDCCNDHVGHNRYAWDFATFGPFEVVAPRAGTIVHVKMSSNHGGDESQVDSSNYIVIDHGDGTASVMLHLAHNSLDPAIHCGAFVRQGQRLATTGATGWATGNHLHFQVNRIPANMPATCECGANGMACGENDAHWDLFWSRDDQTASVPIDFDDWHGASQCANRHDDLVLTSQNVDRHEAVVPVDTTRPERFVPLRGGWTTANGGVCGPYHASTVGSDASAMIPFRGVVAQPGVYEVWTALPASQRNRGAAVARAEVIARGSRTSQMQRQNVPGGGYHRLQGRFKLTGRTGEGVMLSSFARDNECLAVDNVLLRRVADVGNTAVGGACHSSEECAGDGVCSVGVCRAGCDTAGCPDGDVCEPTGMCRSGTNVASQADARHAMARSWDSPIALAGANTATSASASAIPPHEAPSVDATATGGGAQPSSIHGHHASPAHSHRHRHTP